MTPPVLTLPSILMPRTFRTRKRNLPFVWCVGLLAYDLFLLSITNDMLVMASNLVMVPAACPVWLLKVLVYLI